MKTNLLWDEREKICAGPDDKQQADQAEGSKEGHIHSKDQDQ